MFCEKCGCENPDGAKFCSECGEKFESKHTAVKSETDKSMAVAIIISFILPALGIAYAGDKKKGIILFIAGVVLNILGRAVPIFAVAGMAIWVYGLFETYNEVERARGNSNPNLVEDWKSWQGSKKIGATIFIIIVILIFLGSAVGAFMPDDTEAGIDDSADSDSSSSVSSSASASSSSSGGSSASGSSSSSGGSYSNGDEYYTYSSDGHDVSSHYEGEHGSSDTEGTIHNDGSVDSHQTGHTDYGDYEIDSHMDSDGNIHGTVDVGGKTYYVDT